MKCAWMFYLNSNNYYVYMLIGAYKNLLDTKTKYPIYCAITKNVNSATKTLLTKIGLNLVELDTSKIDNCKLSVSDLSWYKQALYKLAILDTNIEQMFDKIVYLDSDMQILQNIDELMKKPHMSAVVNHAPKFDTKEYKVGDSNFCSGLFIWDFKKNPGLGAGLLNTLSSLNPKISWHDQSILNFWYSNWANQNELHLDPIYGLMNTDYIYDSLIDKSKLKIIHFVSRDRINWPFNKQVIANKSWREFKNWVKNISNSCNFFNEKYNLNIPKIITENIK